MLNLNTLDRLLRTLLGFVLLELAFFWLSGPAQVGAYLIGAILLGTAAVRFCPLYRLLGLSTARHGASVASMPMKITAGVLLAAVLAGGSYASVFFTRKLFLEDFNVLNNYYKQTLFLTGKNERENAIANYERLIPAYQLFQSKYASFKPYVLKGDNKFDPDLAHIAKLLADVGPTVRTGDLHQAHLALEQVRSMFQDIFKRNGFSMLSVALVDFHDAMELMLDAANAKDPGKLGTLYPQVSDKLKAVEAEANDGEIQTIRKNLDSLLSLANEARIDQLPTKGEELKSSFIKVYLKQG